MVLLSHDYWQRRFEGAPDVLGKRFRRRDRDVRIVGVLPPGFSELDLGSSPEAWLPIARGQGGRILVVLRENAGPSQLEASLRPALEEYLKQEPPSLDRRLTAVDASKGMRSGIRNRFATPMTTVALAAILLLLIGCSNVGLLLAALHAQRRPEMAVRVALGASRGRLVRQVLVETWILAAAACVLGAALAPIIVRVLLTLASDPDRPIRIEWQWDWRFAVVAIVLCAFATVLSAALPAFRLPGLGSVHSVRDRLAIGRAGHDVVIAGQAGLAVVLLVGGGLLQTTWVNLNRLDPGFEKERLV